MADKSSGGTRAPLIPDDIPEILRIPGYAAGLGTEVVEAQRSGTVEQIVVHQGVPMGPRGAIGPTGPTGSKGESTEWSVGTGPPPDPTAGSEVGEIWLDTSTGDVWVLTDMGWSSVGNLMGPTGPTGPVGEPAYLEVGSVQPGGPGEADVDVRPNPAPPNWIMDFVVPQGPTGPIGPAPAITTGVVTSVGPDTAPSVSMHGANSYYVIDWWLQQGSTGPAGTNIHIIGSLPTVGPPPTQGGEVGGDGWVDSNGDVWVWSEEMPGWVNTGPVVGPPGATGPTGPGYRAVVLDLPVVDDGAGKGVIPVPHLLAPMSPYPSTRILLEDSPGSGVYTDAQSVYIYYPSTSEVRVEMDVSMAGQTVRVVLM